MHTVWVDARLAGYAHPKLGLCSSTHPVWVEGRLTGYAHPSSAYAPPPTLCGWRGD